MKTEIETPREWRVPLTGYLAWLAAIPRPETTRYQRSYHLRRFAAETGLSPRAVTHDDLIVYLGSHGWGKSTIHAARSTFRSFFLWAHRVAKIIEDDPAALLPATRPEAGGPRPAAEHVVFEAIATADDRVTMMLRLAAGLGLRCCEIAKFHTGDVQLNSKGAWIVMIRGKGGKKREVPLPERLAADLRALEPGYLFPGQIDGHLSAGYVSKLVSRALPRGVTAHMLRHRFASITYEAERDIRAVQELLGHSNVSTTQTYTRVPDDAKRRAVELAAA